ncbi:MAG: energy transducer TonB [Pseudomonadota bacterium]|nr:energy transducer TonB [Pseudomonadota bacterium]
MKKMSLALLCFTLFNAPVQAADNFPWVLDTAHCIFPDYPREAARNEETGTTMLEFLIRTDGSIAATLVKTSSGSQALDMAAQDALAKCNFKLQGAEPKEEMWQKMAYVWQLSDSDGLLQRRIDLTTCGRTPYPAGARKRDMTGTLSLGLLVRPDGSVRETRLTAGSGHPELDSATRTAMAACRFLDGPARAVEDEWVKMDYVWTQDDWPPTAIRKKN